MQNEFFKNFDLFGLYRFINTKFLPAISTSSIRNQPTVFLFLTVIYINLFAPRKAVKITHEFEVLCVLHYIPH